MRSLSAQQWFVRMWWSLALVATVLTLVGWLAIARSEQLMDRDAGHLRHQMIWSAIALAVMLAITWPNYRLLTPWSYVAFGLALVLLTAVYFFPAINHAHRWIRLKDVGFQPSEFAKVAFVLALARYLMYRDTDHRLTNLLLPLGLMIVPMLLVLREPDLGTSLIFPPVLLAMLWAAGARRRDLTLLIVIGLLLLPVMWAQMSAMQRSRVTALWEQTAPGEHPTRDGYHLHQAKQMLALGGTWGRALAGVALPDHSAYNVPEVHTDSIFAVLAERFGLWGAGLVLLLYALLVWRSLAIAGSIREPFGRLVAVGLASLVAVQVLINTGMIVGLLPITGVPLPFLSYGGSGLVSNFLALGLILNIGLRPGYEVTNEPFG